MAATRDHVKCLQKLALRLAHFT